MNIWFIIAIAVIILLILFIKLNQASSNEYTNQVKKWETHPFRNEILNNTISLVNKELAFTSHTIAPNESYSVVIYIYYGSCEIGIDWIAAQKSRHKCGGVYGQRGYCLNTKMRMRFAAAGYQNITSTQRGTLRESLMRGLKDQFASDSEILISSNSYYSHTLEHSVSEVRVDITKKFKKLKKIEI